MPVRPQTGPAEHFKLLQIGQTGIVNPTTGAQLRNHHLARQLAKEMRVTHIGFDDRCEALSNPCPLDGVRVKLIPKEASYTIGKLARGVLGRVPATILNYRSERMAAAIAEALAQDCYDVVQIEGVEMFSYLKAIRSAPHRARHVVWDWHNIESELMRRYSLHAANPFHRLYARRAASQVKNAEREILDQCDLHLTMSERERQELQRVNPAANVTAVENGVDVHQFSGLLQAGEDRTAWTARKRVLFVGSMDYHANVNAVRYFADKVWAPIHRQQPGAVFTIVGRNPPQCVTELAARPGIEVTGTVSDVRPYYSEAFAVVVPLQVGGGTRLKILEAMAAGVPVVSTTLGAEGLETIPELHIEIADRPETFCARVGELRKDYSRWRDLSFAARKLAEARYDWGSIGKKLIATYREMLDASNASGKERAYA